MNEATSPTNRLLPVLFICCVLLTAVFTLSAWPAAADDPPAAPGLFWSDQSSDRIYHANLDGSQITELVLVTPKGYLYSPRALVLDQAAGAMYFAARLDDTYETDYPDYRLWRAGLDGSDPQPALPGLARPFNWQRPADLDLDSRDHTLYWPSYLPHPYTEPPAGSIVRGDPAGGTSSLRLMPGPTVPNEPDRIQAGLKIDGGMVYWVDSSELYRTTLDGVETSRVDLGGRQTDSWPAYFTPFAVDGEAGIIYYVGYFYLNVAGDPIYALFRMTLANPNLEQVLVLLDPDVEIRDIAVDTVHDKLYWTQGTAGWGMIRRANLDGTAVETILDSLPTPFGLVLDPPAGTVTWADWYDRKIRRANLDGSAPHDLVDTAPVRPMYPALNKAQGLLYWTGEGDGRVWQAPIDGGPFELLVPSDGASTTGGLAYDDLADALIWVDAPRMAVTTARGDGSAVHDILYPRVGDARALFIEEESDKLVWYDLYYHAIKRANLDGSAAETVLSGGFDEATSLAWDPLRRLMCWTDPLLRHIECCGWNGENRRVVLGEADGLRRPSFLAIDAHAGQLYWTDWSTASLSRANLDGSDQRVLVPGTLVEPSGLALNLPPLSVERHYMPLLVAP
jgi:hypothetical protein